MWRAQSPTARIFLRIVFRRDRKTPGRFGGGILIAVRNSMKASPKVFVDLLFSNNRNITLGIKFYRPPNNETKPLEDLKQALDNLSTSELILVGDFNLPETGGPWSRTSIRCLIFPVPNPQVVILGADQKERSCEDENADHNERGLWTRMLFTFLIKFIYACLRIGSSLACVYRVMDARGKFGEHERSVRVARGAAESNSSFLSALQTSQVHP